MQNEGVPASPSGYSAEPEPSCTVSAVPVSIPNAQMPLEDALADYANQLLTLAAECDTKGGQTGRHHHLMLTASAATNVAHMLFAAASAIEARRAATENTGAVHESASPKDDAHE